MIGESALQAAHWGPRDKFERESRMSDKPAKAGQTHSAGLGPSRRECNNATCASRGDTGRTALAMNMVTCHDVPTWGVVQTSGVDDEFTRPTVWLEASALKSTLICEGVKQEARGKTASGRCVCNTLCHY